MVFGLGFEQRLMGSVTPQLETLKVKSRSSGTTFRTACPNFEDLFFTDVSSRRTVIVFSPQHATCQLVLSKASTVPIVPLLIILNKKKSIYDQKTGVKSNV
jgi:hypothetical protein